MVRKFDSVNLASKLPFIIVFFAVVIAVVTSSLAFLEERNLAILNAEARLSQVTHARMDTVEVWLDGVGDELVTQAANPHTHTVMAAFSAGFEGFGSPVAQLHQLYITDNPNPTGSKHLLDAAGDGSAYSQTHGHYHGYFRDVLDRYGYYDIFFINPEGDIVYTVFKELDFATNLLSGEYADSGLAEAFRIGRDLAAGEVGFVDYAPYAPSYGAPAAFLSTPVFDDSGTLVGVLSYQLPSDRLYSLISNPEGLGETGEIFLFGSDLQSRAASRLGTVEEVLAPISPLPQFTDEMADDASLIGVTGFAGANALAVFGHVDVFGQSWRAVAEVEMGEILAPLRAILLKTVIEIIIAGIIVSFLAMRISRTITIPLQKVRDAVARVAKGDYDLNLRATDRGDEIGFIATTLMQLCERLKESDRMEEEARAEQEAQARVVEMLSTSLGALAKGDLGCQISETFPQDYERLRQDFNLTVTELTQTISAVSALAERIGAGAGEITGASDDLSQRTENQAATLEQTAAAIDELTHSVNAAADSAKEVETIVNDAKAHAESSGEVVQSAVNTMSDIEQSSGKIVQIISVIDDIAFQTNLLALNAGVEAARAGEAGRGFAVVASEVRALAQRSSEAAKEIKELISSSSQQVEDGAKLVARAGEALTSIVERVTHISGLMTEIAQGAGEQAVSLGEVNTGIASLDQVTQQNAAMVQENTTTAHGLNSESDALISTVGHFRVPGDHSGGSHGSSHGGEDGYQEARSVA